MPAFKKFGPGDQIDNVLVLEPQYHLSSGSGGWRGSPEGSASLNLYGGFRRRQEPIITEIEYQPLFPEFNQVGPPKRTLPITASINIVTLRNEELGLADRSATRWGENYWAVMNRLYDDYRSQDPDYITGSYDFYCLYFQKDSANVVAEMLYTSGTVGSLSYPVVRPTASFALEAWIKPFMTASNSRDFTIQSYNGYFWFGITGSSGKLAISASNGVHISTYPVSLGSWTHVAYSYDAAIGTGTFYIDAVSAGTASHPVLSSSIEPCYTVGGRLPPGPSIESATGSAVIGSSFHGLIGETRFWTSYRTDDQLSALYNVRMTGTIVAEMGSYIQLREGPLVQVDTLTRGSGTIDYARFSQQQSSNSSVVDGVVRLNSFGDRTGPVWLPSDNRWFYPDKSMVTSSMAHRAWSSTTITPNVSVLKVIDIPSAFYGRQIVPNSVVMTCRAYASASHGLVRTLIDDGRGGLFVSGSMFSGSADANDVYRGVEWNKVGNVFYGEGLIVIKDPSLLDFGKIEGAPSAIENTFELSFRGTTMLPVKTLMCRIDRGEFNCSTNPTFYTTEEDGNRVKRHTSGNLYVSTVGVYNADRELVGVARLADPLRIRPRDRLNIKLRIDF